MHNLQDFERTCMILTKNAFLWSEPHWYLRKIDAGEISREAWFCFVAHNWLETWRHNLLALFLGAFGEVGTVEELSLEQLHGYDGEDEMEEKIHY